MFKVRELKFHDIYLSVPYQGQQINCVLTTGIKDGSGLYVIVPGLFGDRTDSRHMFTRLSQAMAEKGYSVLRFDYIGGGSTQGDYSKNDFDLMLSTLSHVVRYVLDKFPFFKQVGLVAFSEGGKIAIRAIDEIPTASFICFCNAILVPEENMNEISRPKIRDQRLVYDSNFGTWVNWEIVEKYRSWNVEILPDKRHTRFAAVYSGSDPLTKNSLAFLEKNNIPILRIPDADHLFTRAQWLELLIEKVVKHIEKNESVEGPREKEVKLLSEYGAHCVRIIEGRSKDMIIFVHGLGQNKSGPGFLFSQIAEKLCDKTLVFFDFYGMGDSEFDEKKFLGLRLNDYVGQLKFVYNYYTEKYSPSRVTFIASGTGCQIAQKFVASYAVSARLLLIGPSKSNLFGLLDTKEQQLSFIDTYDVFQKYQWAENEFSKLGNVPNRIRGMKLNPIFLKDLYEYSLECKELSILLINSEEGESVSLPIKDRLLMSAVEREKAIKWISEVLE